MPDSATYNSVVAARTRVAEQILGNKGLHDLYIATGGLKKDLEAIRDRGDDAEAFATARAGVKAQGGGATVEVLRASAALQHEYKGIMAVLRAVRDDLEEAAAPAAVVRAVEQILVNEAEVALRSEQQGVDAEGKAKVKRTRRPKLTQEAIRAEIARDAGALLSEKGAHAALAARGVDKKRLEKLRAAADALSGKLGDRVVAKTAGKDNTAAQKAAVIAQRKAWSKVYRILARVGRGDQRVAALLKEAARNG